MAAGDSCKMQARSRIDHRLGFIDDYCHSRGRLFPVNSGRNYFSVMVIDPQHIGGRLDYGYFLASYSHLPGSSLQQAGDFLRVPGDLDADRFEGFDLVFSQPRYSGCIVNQNHVPLAR